MVIACYARISCTALISWLTASYVAETYVATETGGRWSPLVRLAAPDQSNNLGQALWCSPQGKCAAIETAQNASGPAHLYVSDGQAGTWQRPSAIMSTEPVDMAAGSVAFSCSQPGYCVLAGAPPSATTLTPASIVMTDTGGRWRLARIVNAATGPLGVDTASCSYDGSCVLGGSVSRGQGCPATLRCTAVPILLAQRDHRPVLQEEIVLRHAHRVTVTQGQVADVACNASNVCYFVLRDSRATQSQLLEWTTHGLAPVSIPAGALVSLECVQTASECAVVTLQARIARFVRIESGRLFSVASWTYNSRNPFSRLVSLSCADGGRCALFVPQLGNGDVSAPGSYVIYTS